MHGLPPAASSPSKSPQLPNPSSSLAHIQMSSLAPKVPASFSVAILNWEQFCPLGDIWQNLETFLMDTTGWVGSAVLGPIFYIPYVWY